MGVIATVLSAAGCGSGGTQLALSDLEGRTFLADRLFDGDTERPSASAEPIRLDFGDGSVQAWGGCNHLSAGVQLDGSTLVIDSPATTEMACEQDLMDQDRWLSELLGARPSVLVAGNSLTLRTAERTLELHDGGTGVPAPLRDVTWVLESLVQGETTSSTPNGVESTLRLEGDRLSVLGGCNRAGAVATVEDGMLVVGKLTVTQKACGDARMELDRTVFDLLAKRPTVEIDERHLRLSAGDRALVYALPG